MVPGFWCAGLRLPNHHSSGLVVQLCVESTRSRAWAEYARLLPDRALVVFARLIGQKSSCGNRESGSLDFSSLPAAYPDWCVWICSSTSFPLPRWARGMESQYVQWSIQYRHLRGTELKSRPSRYIFHGELRGSNQDPVHIARNTQNPPANRVTLYVSVPQSPLDSGRFISLANSGYQVADHFMCTVLCETSIQTQSALAVIGSRR